MEPREPVELEHLALLRHVPDLPPAVAADGPEQEVRAVEHLPVDLRQRRGVPAAPEDGHVAPDAGAGAEEEVAPDDPDVALDPSLEAHRRLQDEEGAGDGVRPGHDGVAREHPEVRRLQEPVEPPLLRPVGPGGEVHVLGRGGGRQGGEEREDGRDRRGADPTVPREPPVRAGGARRPAACGRHRAAPPSQLSHATTSSRGSRSGRGSSPSG